MDHGGGVSKEGVREMSRMLQTMLRTRRATAEPVSRARFLGKDAGASTIMFVFTLFWAMVILFVFIQFALIGYTWQVTGYAAYASGRARIVGALFNGDYKDVADNVMEGSVPEHWGNTWIVQELPFGIGVVVLYAKSIRLLGFNVPVPVVGRSEIPYSKLNPWDPVKPSWRVGDNNG